jgi:molecular chaperone GrpE
MNAKRTVFPQHSGKTGSGHESGEKTEYRDPPLDDDPRPPRESARNAARGRAAYAFGGEGGEGGRQYRQPAPDEMPPFEPSPSFSPFGDIPDETIYDMPADHAGEQPEEVGIPASVSHGVLAEVCRERICPGCPERKAAADERLRAAADLDNARKRLVREREEQVRFAAESVLSALIPSLDNLDLALQHASTDAACKDFVTGVRMTRKLMGDALTAQGLEQIGRIGEEFDPAVHEAVGTEDFPDIAAGCVGKLLTSGYKLHERLLRPARVLVCKKHEIAVERQSQA